MCKWMEPEYRWLRKRRWVDMARRMVNRPTPGKLSWGAYSLRPRGTRRKAMPSAMRIPQPTSAPSKPPRSSVSAWIWKLAEQHLPGAVQIVDLYHARQHLWDIARMLHPNNAEEQKAWMKIHQK